MSCTIFVSVPQWHRFFVDGGHISRLVAVPDMRAQFGKKAETFGMSFGSHSGSCRKFKPESWPGFSKKDIHEPWIKSHRSTSSLKNSLKIIQIIYFWLNFKNGTTGKRKIIYPFMSLVVGPPKKKRITCKSKKDKRQKWRINGKQSEKRKKLQK